MIIKKFNVNIKSLKDLLDFIKYNKINFKDYLIYIVLGLLLFSIIIVFSIWNKNSNYRVLFSNISDKESGAIIEELHHMKIPYNINSYNGIIMVPNDKLFETRFILAQKGLPTHGSWGFELLDKEKIGKSQFNEQINYQRALEGEISRTIEKINLVKSARVHLSIPKSSPFINEKRIAKASVILTLYPNMMLSTPQIQSIACLVSGAVQDLSINNINIVDNRGQLLSFYGENNEFLIDNRNIKYAREIEYEYQRRILSILSPIIGIENVHAEVTAQMDFTVIEQTQEYHKPNKNSKDMAIRSKQFSSKRMWNIKKIPEGTPGAHSNYPVYENESKIQKNENNDAIKNNYQSIPNSNNTEKIINYEIDKTLTHTKFHPGILKKLSVAVVINSRKDQNGNNIKFTPEEIQDINLLVQEAIGYSSERGDTIDVVNINFLENETKKESNFLYNKKLDSFLFNLIFYIIMLLITLFIIIKFYKIFKNILKGQDEIQKVNRNISVDNEKSNASTEDELQKLKDIINSNPRLVASILRQWINKEKD